MMTHSLNVLEGPYSKSQGSLISMSIILFQKYFKRYKQVIEEVFESKQERLFTII